MKHQLGNESKKRDPRTLGGGNSKIFYFQARKSGEMIQFDEQIFQMGWFNHQLVGV